MASRDESLEVITFEPGVYLLDALLDGSIDAALGTRGYIAALTDQRELFPCEIDID